MALLSVESIDKSFGATHALAGVSLSAEAGEVLAIVGENGSGKSTLMRILAGEETPNEGSMTLSGKPYEPRNPIEARENGVALIHQELALCEHLTIAENVVLGGEPLKGIAIDRSEVHNLARRLLDEMGYPELSAETEVRRLSPAMKQVVEIAKALARNAKVIIFDEPTSSLGKNDVEHLFEQIRKLRAKGAAVIYISHFLDEVMEIADKACILRDGALVGSVNVKDTSIKELVSMMVGREVKDLYPRADHHPAETLLEISNVHGRKMPIEASLQVRKGEVLGIAGLNGSGRTELLRVLFGLDSIQSGKIKFAVYEGPSSAHDRWRQGMGFLSEDRKLEGLALNLSITENMLLPRPGRRGIVHPKKQIASAKKWIDALRIKSRSPEQAIKDLSGGNQQKVALARLLEQNVDLYLLDEPTRGIDLGSKAEIYQVIDNLARDGKTVILVSSYLPELLGVCDRIAVMSRGRLAAPVNAQETNAEMLMEACVG